MKRFLFIFALMFLVAPVSKAQTVNDILSQGSSKNSYFYNNGTGGTTTVKAGSGVFRSLTVQGGTAGGILVFDNTAASGTAIANFDSTAALTTYPFNVPFTTGLTIKVSANTKVTVVYN